MVLLKNCKCNNHRETLEVMTLRKIEIHNNKWEKVANNFKV